MQTAERATRNELPAARREENRPNHPLHRRKDIPKRLKRICGACLSRLPKSPVANRFTSARLDGRLPALETPMETPRNSRPNPTKCKADIKNARAESIASRMPLPKGLYQSSSCKRVCNLATSSGAASRRPARSGRAQPPQLLKQQIRTARRTFAIPNFPSLILIHSLRLAGRQLCLPNPGPRPLPPV